MIDPTKIAERQYDAIAKIIEEHGFVKDLIVAALKDELLDTGLFGFVFREGATNTVTNCRVVSRFEHYTPIPAKETDQ